MITYPPLNNNSITSVDKFPKFRKRLKLAAAKCELQLVQNYKLNWSFSNWNNRKLKRFGTQTKILIPEMSLIKKMDNIWMYIAKIIVVSGNSKVNLILMLLLIPRSIRIYNFLKNLYAMYPSYMDPQLSVMR